MSSSAGPSCVMSSNVPAASSSSHGAGPRLHLLGLVLGALHRQAEVGHLLAHAAGGLADLDLRLGGGVLRLDDLLLGAEGLDLGAHLLLVLGERLLLLLELRDLSVERLQLGLGDRLALERRAREILAVPPASAWRACVSSFTTCCWICSSCIWRRFLDVTTSAMPFLTFWSSSSCLL